MKRLPARLFSSDQWRLWRALLRLQAQLLRHRLSCMIWHTTSADEEDRQARIQALKPFLAQSTLLEESGPPRVMRAMIVTTAAAVGGFLIWSAIASFNETAIGLGEIVPANQAKPVQHLEGGIVKTVLVSDGDLVKPGQILIAMAEESTRSALDQARAQHTALAARAERLRAFALERAPQFAAVKGDLAQLVEDQKDILLMQSAARDQGRAVLRAQIDGRRKQVDHAKEQILSAGRNAGILEQEFAMQRELLKKDLTSKVTYLETQRRLNTARGAVAEAFANEGEALTNLGETELRLQEFDARLRNEALAEMGAVSAELAKARAELAAREDAAARLYVKAPVHGYVKGLAVRDAGGVVAPGQVLMEIVPVDEALVAEVKISPRDIGHLSVGKPAIVKVSTYDHARFGTIAGRVTHLSASSFKAEDGQTYFRGIISLQRSFVGHNPRSNHIAPGMTVSADIITGRKSLLSYLVRPISNALDTAFHER